MATSRKTVRLTGVSLTKARERPDGRKLAAQYHLAVCIGVNVVVGKECVETRNVRGVEYGLDDRLFRGVCDDFGVGAAAEQQRQSAEQYRLAGTWSRR